MTKSQGYDIGHKVWLFNDENNWSVVTMYCGNKLTWTYRMWVWED
jgi:hypothetical protein